MVDINQIIEKSDPHVELINNIKPVSQENADDVENKVKNFDVIDTIDELTALTSSNLEFTGDLDDLPQFKLQNFFVVDSDGNQITLDCGLIEEGKDVFVCGQISSLIKKEDNAGSNTKLQNNICDSIDISKLVKVGPIDEWYSCGFDGGRNALLSVFSPYAHYYLELCAAEHLVTYAPFLLRVMVLKFIFESIVENYEIQYNEMINNVLSMISNWTNDANSDSQGKNSIYECSEDFIVTNAQFIIDQLADFDLNPEENEMPFLASFAILDLIDLSGATIKIKKKLQKPKKRSGATKQKIKDEANVLRSKKMAVTTPLVRKLFDDIFSGQLANVTNKKDKSSLKNEQLVDGNLENSDEEILNDALHPGDILSDSSFVNYSNDIKIPQNMKTRDFLFKDPLDIIFEGRKYFKSLYIESQNENISVGDFVSVFSKGSDYKIALVTHFYVQHNTYMCHIIWMAKGEETVLGCTADANEIFLTMMCADIKCSAILHRLDIIPIHPPKDWSSRGGKFDGDEIENYYKQQNILYFKMTYDFKHTRFIYPHIELSSDYHLENFHCSNCLASIEKELKNYPMISNLESNISKNDEESFNSFNYRGKVFKIDDCVFIENDCYSFKFKPNLNLLHRLEIDLQKKAEMCNKKYHPDSCYTEKYRKNENSFRNLNYNTDDPWQIGQIKQIKFNNSSKTVDVKLLVFCRPTDLNLPSCELMSEDFNKLFLTEIVVSISAKKIIDHVIVLYSLNDSIPLYDKSSKNCPIFYFSSCYNKTDGTINLVDQNISSNFSSFDNFIASGKERGDLKVHPNLAILDIFSGCGGLSIGLEESGLGTTKWALEFEESAAEAFKLNHKKCDVFCANSNDVLQHILDGKESFDGMKLPKPGEVDLLCGGPPCQGFSGMNRFNFGEYSRFKNSLIANCLSFVEKLRPRFVLIENVRNFASFKRSAILRITLRAMIRMGYQVSFAVLQAGGYGISQTRRRTIILAAAPEQKLPFYPQPTHCFPMNAGTSVTIDGIRYESNLAYLLPGAPLRTVTNYDSIGDLQPIKDNPYRKNKENILLDTNEVAKNVNSYQLFLKSNVKGDPKSHFCKEMKDLVYERISYVPTKTGSDWRDLPNISLTLDDGSYIDTLRYINKKGHVCACALSNDSKKIRCNPDDRQSNTLIPWCLPHTSDRHNQWSGLYGRLPWSGFFGTTITNPEPMGKQGRVIHPDQNRVISVRECARSQGFKDNFSFYGSILDQHRQIGNAVPPPLAKALGTSILESLGY